MHNGKVDINHASREQLNSLTGLSEKNISSIIEYRRANGDFQSIDEIENVPGIDGAIMSKLRGQISVPPRKESDRVDLNHARREELESLPNIGTHGAEAIINYRKTNGEFKSIDEVDNITGVDGYVLQSLKKTARV